MIFHYKGGKGGGGGGGGDYGGAPTLNPKQNKNEKNPPPEFPHQIFIPYP